MTEGNATFAELALKAMLDKLDEGAILFEGRDLVCRSISPRALEILGGLADGYVGRSRDAVLKAILPGDGATERALAALTGIAPEESRSETLAIKREPPRLVEWTTVPIEVGDSTVGRVELLADRTVEGLLREELDRAYSKMATISLVDDLTGLANRKHFESEIDREHRRSQRSWASYAVVRADVDGMGKLNEELGQDAGDTLLKRAGEGLKAARREYDLVARWENDELIVLLPGIDERAVKSVVLRSLSAMRDAARDAVGREVTFCAGVAVWIPPSVETTAGIIDRAGAALRAAKAIGAGRVEIDARVIEWKDDTAATG